jgi:large subunit ribosomal protein L9
MKVVLTKDIRDMGRSGSIIEVSDGHAINFLFPRKMAVAATASNLKQAESRQKQVDEKHAVDAALIAETLQALAEIPTVIVKKANDKGHLYDAVDAADIAAATKLPEDAIRLEKPIKELGEFEIPVSYGDNFGSIKVLIEAE